jgi:hypothetical protein
MVSLLRIEFTAHNIAHKFASGLILAGMLLGEARGTEKENNRKE